jgi:predicted nucleic acid-binding protein
MLKFVIDSNVIWSTAYNAKSEIGQFILTVDSTKVKFYAPEYLKIEIEKHFAKIVRYSKQSEEEVRTVLELAYRKIDFISDDQIPFKSYSQSVKYVRGVDMDDLVFVALADYLQAPLWTGDRKLIEGLLSRGHQNVIDFKEVIAKIEIEK